MNCPCAASAAAVQRRSSASLASPPARGDPVGERERAEHDEHALPGRDRRARAADEPAPAGSAPTRGARGAAPPPPAGTSTTRVPPRRRAAAAVVRAHATAYASSRSGSAAASTIARGGGDHRRIVGAERERRGRRLRQRSAQLGVRGDAADDRDLLGAELRGGLARPLDERADDRALVRGGEVGAPLLELVGGQVAHGVEERGLHAGEGEVEPGHLRDREVVRVRVALAWRAGRSRRRPGSRGRAAARPCRTPRRLRRRASSRARGTPHGPGRRAAACARRSRAGRGTAARPDPAEVERGDVAVQVVDRDERQPAPQRDPLGGGEPDEQRADRAPAPA